MMYLSCFDAKAEVSAKDINKEREKWVEEGRDKQLLEKCRSVKRYEVIGKSPLQIVFIIDTDDPTALNILARHFGKKWNCVTYPVIERDIRAALQADTTIVAG
ncbi:hypothetical protein ACFL6N_05035 [Thermodesulfobacteriota bacterium]